MTICDWCEKAGVKSPYVEDYKRMSDEKIIETLHDFKALTEGELRHLLGYKLLSQRLQRMIRDDVILSTRFGGKGRGAVKYIVFPEYGNVTLYYVTKDDLIEWIKMNLPRRLTSNFRKAVTRKLRAVGIDTDYLFPKTKRTGISLDVEVHERIKEHVGEKTFIKDFVSEAIMEKLEKEKGD